MPASASVNNPSHDGSGVKSTIKSIIQGVLIMIGIQFIIGIFSGKNPRTIISNSIEGNVESTEETHKIPPFFSRHKTLNDNYKFHHIPNRIAPIWPSDTFLDIIIAVSSSSISQPIHTVPPNRVVLNESRFQLGNYSDERNVKASFDVPIELQNNGTLWGHFYIGITGESLDPSTSNYNPERSFNFTWPLTQYLAQKKLREAKNLLAKSDQNVGPGEEEISLRPKTVSHYHPNFTMSFIPDIGVQNFYNIQPAMRQYFHLEASNARDATGQNSWYYPVLFINTFWQLRTHKIPLNSTVKHLPININLNNMANWKFGLISSIDENTKQSAKAAATQGNSISRSGDGSELEMLKEILLDTNPYLLATTIAGIILLYLMDNNENTSWMILFSQGMGIVLELWKISTIVNVRVSPSHNLIGFKILFEDKHVLSTTEKKTKEYDAIAFKYLYMIAVPLLFAYATYSVTYESHRSWYSFVISTLVGSVYAYGFLMMVPSLYINYRLKSVAHMPAKAMIYKFLNTFIDDLFAFTIKMPTLHRLATFRDDVIFFVYLYQSWRYRTDHTRVNEFGQCGEEANADTRTQRNPNSKKT